MRIASDNHMRRAKQLVEELKDYLSPEKVEILLHSKQRIGKEIRVQYERIQELKNKLRGMSDNYKALTRPKR